MRRLRLALGVLTGTVWALSFVAAVVTGQTTIFGFVTPVMLVIVTALFAFARNGNGRA